MAFDLKDAGAIVETSAGDDGIIMAAPGIASPRPAPYKWSAIWAYIQSKSGSALGYNVGTAEGEIPLLGSGGKLPHAQMNLVSVPLSGSPTAPTASPGTNTTQIANTAFVQAAITALINAAPGALDTLDELAAALGDDANFATTVTNSLALKAPLASPTFTGTPAAPTASPGTSTTQIATTAFVASATAAIARQISSAEDVLGGEEGFAFDAISDTSLVYDRTGAKSNSGYGRDILAVTRATTATYIDRDRLLKSAATNTLRYDHNPSTGVPKGALIEPAATNLLTYSEQFDNGAWSKTGCTVTANAATAVTGSATADKLVEDSSTGPHFLAQGSGVTTAQTYTISVFAKAAERSRIRLELSDFFAEARGTYVDLSTGSIVSTDGAGSVWTSLTASIEAWSNGWYRVRLTGTKSASGAASGAIFLISTGTTVSYAGDGTSGVYIDGAQLEVGSYATSYIPTTSATVTRNADAVSIATSLIPLDATQGTLFAEFSCDVTVPSAIYDAIVSLNDGTISDRIILYWNQANDFGGYIADGGVDQALIGATTISVGATTKGALSYRTNDVKMCVNGGSVATDTSTTLPTVTILALGNPTPNVTKHTRRVAYISRALTSTELQALTT